MSFGDKVLEILHHSSNLIKCNVDVDNLPDPPAWTGPLINLSHLTVFKITAWDNPIILFNHIHVPSLCNFKLCVLGQDGKWLWPGAFLTLISQSSCCICFLHFDHN